MKILLIAPLVDINYGNVKELTIPALGLYMLQGLTPPQHQVKIVEEEMEDLNLDEECDLVGISCMTCTAPRSYELAKEFKKRGRTVVMGGVHPTIMPDEVLQHADSIIIGEAEGVWRQLLVDFAQGKLQRKYHQSEPDLSEFIPIDFHNMKTGGFKYIPLITTRGCPFNCDFCSIAGNYGKKIRHIPVNNILRYIKESEIKYVFFQDDNIIADPVYAKELFRAITPLRVKWAAQASISIANDPELLELASTSGCKGLFIGIETISELKLKSLQKQASNLDDMADMIKKIRRARIHIYASMVVGFDFDTKETLDKTVDFLIKNWVSAATFNILTPYPNTKLFLDLKKEGRLLTTNWKYYGHNTAVFQPKNMTPRELQYGTLAARKKFYSRASIIKRFFSNLYYPQLFIVSNIANLQEIKRLEKKWSQGIGLPDYLLNE
ncbi:MAG TPA: radical SAM protein [bacterium]|nr:radical SAM protein [bacterium]